MKMDSEDIERLNPAGLLDSRAYGFSQVVTAPSGGRTVLISGQFSGNVAGGVQGATVPEQMSVAFENLRIAIEAAGARPEQVIRFRVLSVDHREAYLTPLARHMKAFLGDHLPASTLIPVPRLALDAMLFEIEATLFRPD